MLKENGQSLGHKIFRGAVAAAMFGSSFLPHTASAQEINLTQPSDHHIWVVCLGKEDPLEFIPEGFITHDRYINYTGDMAVVRLTGFRDQSYVNFLRITELNPETGAFEQRPYVFEPPALPESTFAQMPRGLSFQAGYLTQVDITSVS